MAIKIFIKTESESFQNGNKTTELQKILKDLSSDISSESEISEEYYSILFDSGGHPVGEAIFEPDND